MDSLLLVLKGIVLTVLAFGLMVFFHELGHFLAAKLIGVRVDRFSFGLGPRLLGHKWGQTEYMVSAVPIGGYVKMAGGDEGEESTGAPDEFVSKPPGLRAIVMVAGPLFSILFGVPTAMGMLLVGREVFLAKVSDVTVQGPAWNAGAEFADRITSLDGRPIETFEDLRQATAESPSDTPVEMGVDRRGKAETLTVKRPKGERLGVVCTFYYLRIHNVLPDSPAAAAGLQPEDLILSVNGTRLREWADFRRLILPNAGKPVELGIERGGKPMTVQVTPEGKDQYDPGFTLRIPPEIGDVRKGFPADGKLLKGDLIAAVNGKPVAGWWDVENAAAEGPDLVAFAVERAGEKLDVQVARGPGARAVDSLGIAPQPVYTVASVSRPSEPALAVGDRVVKVGSREAADLIRDEALYTPLLDVLDFVARAGRVTVDRGGEEIEVSFTPEACQVGHIGVEPASASRFVQKGFFGSIVPAIEQTVSMSAFGFKIIWKLLTGDIKLNNLMGPVGIIQSTYQSAKRGWADLFWLVHLITVSIGVFNLIPIPPLDGGRLAMLGYEKIRGRKPSRRFQEAIIMAGVAIVLLIFIVATFNDVSRLIFGS